MTEEELLQIINKLKQSDEITWIEAKHNFADLTKIGETISALSNSASYQNEEYAYFIWGLEDGTWNLLGTTFDLGKTKNPKGDGEGNTSGEYWLKKIAFEHQCHWNSYQIPTKLGRIYCLKIKNCGNKPITFLNTQKQKTSFIRINSDNDKLANHPEIERAIWNKKIDFDWSAEPCQGATIEDLDLEAVEMARNGYLEKQKKLKNQSQIDIVTKIDLKKEPKKFLKYAKMLTKDDKLSNSCMLLLGKDKSVVNCGFAGEIGYVETTFDIKDLYSIPFQKAIIEVVNKISIKNIELPIKLLGQYTGNNKLLPNYTPDLLREFVANCVAHQDYSQRSRIKVIETIHQSVEFINEGASLYSKQDLEKFQIGNDIPNKYRNEALVNAMIEIGLMEAKGTGYNKLFQYNTKEVYLPLPQINWDNTNQFEVKLYGVPLDKNFADILSQKTNLEPEVILLLDQVQKEFSIDQKIFYNLKKQGLVDGTPTKGKLSFDFMKLIGKENEYIDKSEDEHLKILIYKKIKQTKNCKRQNIENYIYPKFSENLSDKQKYTKLHNMLTILKNEGWIDSQGGKKHAVWIIKKEMKLE